MRGATELERRCDSCGEPAAYKLRGYHEDLCGDCACWRGAVKHGELISAHEALGYAVSKLREVGLADDAVRRVLEATLERPEDNFGYDVSYSEIGNERRDGRWLQNVTGLVEATLPSGGGA